MPFCPLAALEGPRAANNDTMGNGGSGGGGGGGESSGYGGSHAGYSGGGSGWNQSSAQSAPSQTPASVSWGQTPVPAAASTQCAISQGLADAACQGAGSSDLKGTSAGVDMINQGQRCLDLQAQADKACGK